MKKLIIIGGGFAGIAVAKHLENDFAVTLIDLTDYFEFTPGILRTLVEPEHLAKIHFHYSSYLEKSRLITGEVKKICDHQVWVNDQVLDFDYLLISSGSSYESPIKEGVVITARAKNLIESNQKLEGAKKVLIVGGGLVGVELAGEIIERYPTKDLTIIHGAERLMERQPPKASRFAQKFLTKRGVKILVGEFVTKDEAGYFYTNKGTKLKPDLILLCTGIKPNVNFARECFAQEIEGKGFVTNEFLQLVDWPNIFVAGDATAIPEEKTAQNAQAHAKVIIKNIRRLEQGRPLVRYRSRKRLMVISLGKAQGIFTYGNFVWTGFLPGLLKSLIEIREMMSYKKMP